MLNAVRVSDTYQPKTYASTLISGTMVGLGRGTVELEAYQEGWGELYKEEVKRLKGIAGDRFRDFAHIGSTAVEGMPAKPIIDILAVVEDLGAANELIPVLEDHGYEHRPDEVGGRLFFAKGPRTSRSVYLSITEKESDFYEETIAFRNYIQEHSEAAEQYASEKMRLAEQYPENRAKYTAEKGDVIQDILDMAMSE